jgi:hypothetical protein
MGKREAIVAVLRRDDRVLVIRRGPGSRGIGRRSAASSSLAKPKKKPWSERFTRRSG